MHSTYGTRTPYGAHVEIAEKCNGQKYVSVLHAAFSKPRGYWNVLFLTADNTVK